MAASTISSALRRVLVLGSGFTSAPLVECLTRDGGIAVTVGMSLAHNTSKTYLYKHCVIVMYMYF